VTPTTTRTSLAAWRSAVRAPGPLSQFVRFAMVGTAGYVLNVSIFALLIAQTRLDYRVAAALAFGVAVTHNFLWNRHWTFAGASGGTVAQAGRFLAVSMAATGLSLVVLTGLVEVLHVKPLAAQGAATIAVTPVSFAGNRVWTFASEPWRPRLPRGLAGGRWGCP
jgi:dolichol-phosphate mannosyltransferase